MKKRGKRYTTAKAMIEPGKRYELNDAISLIKGMPQTKFDESIDIAVSLGVNPRKADQMVRGTVVLPHGTGKTLRILVFAKGEKEKEALDAGADVAGGDELVEKIRLLPPADFEEFCADLFAESVYAVAPVDQATHTSHALELKQGDEITLVACRRGGAEHRVQQEDLENLAGAMRHHGAVGGIFLTTGSFTDDSRAYAEEKGIELIDAEELQERIAKLEAGVIQKWSR